MKAQLGGEVSQKQATETRCEGQMAQLKHSLGRDGMYDRTALEQVSLYTQALLFNEGGTFCLNRPGFYQHTVKGNCLIWCNKWQC